MHKFLTKIATLSVGLAMAVGVGVAAGSKSTKVSAAGDIEITFPGSPSQKTSSYSKSFDMTVGGVTFTFANWNNGSGSDSWDAIRGGQKSNAWEGTITSGQISSEISKVVVSITQVANSTGSKLEVASNASFTTDLQTVDNGAITATGNVEFEVPSSASNLYYRLTFNQSAGSNGSIRTDKITFVEGGAVTKYSVIDRVDNGTLNKSEVSEGATLNVSIVPDDGYAYPEELTYVYMAGSPVAYTYTGGVITVENVAGNITIEGACIKVNPILALYSKAKGAASGEFYGYYVGFADGSGPILMDGEYGIMLYNASQDVSSWIEGETIVHVTAGTIDIYNGLYEVKSYTCETVASADVSTPVVHVTTGSESAVDANRLTNASGYVPAEPSQGNFTDPAGTKDIKFSFTVGSNTFNVFYKKAAQTDEDIAVLADSLANSTEITLKGFTSWYNGFQMTMKGIVESKEDYTAAIFSQDLIDQTDAVCADYVSDESKFAEIKTALVAIWSDLADVDKYPSLPSGEKTILAEAERDEEGTIVEQAMARYDFLTGKYDLSNFINGRTPIVPAGAPAINADNTLGSSSVITIIVIASLLSVSTIGVCFIIRRRKMY